MPHGALLRQAPRLLRVHQSGGDAADAGPARRRHHRRCRRVAEGPSGLAEPERDQPDGAGKDVHRGGGSDGRGVPGGVQDDAGRAVPPQRGAQHRRHDPLAGLPRSAGVREEDEGPERKVRCLPRACPRGARGPPPVGGAGVRPRRHGGRAAAARRRPEPQRQAHQRRRQGLHPGHDRGGDGKLGGDGGVGHGGDPPAAGHLREGVGGARPGGGEGAVGGGDGHPEPSLHRRHSQGDDAAPPGGAYAGAAIQPGGHDGGGVPRAGGDGGAGERVDRREGPGGVGLAGGVPAGEVRGKERRREGARLRAAAVRGGEEDVPRVRARAEGDPVEPGESPPRVPVEAAGGGGAGGGAQYGGGLRAVHAEEDTSGSRRRAETREPPLRALNQDGRTESHLSSMRVQKWIQVFARVARRSIGIGTILIQGLRCLGLLPLFLSLGCLALSSTESQWSPRTVLPFFYALSADHHPHIGVPPLQGRRRVLLTSDGCLPIVFAALVSLRLTTADFVLFLVFLFCQLALHAQPARGGEIGSRAEGRPGRVLVAGYSPPGAVGGGPRRPGRVEAAAEELPHGRDEVVVGVGGHRRRGGTEAPAK